MDKGSPISKNDASKDGSNSKDDNSSSSRQNVSFKFSKHSAKKLLDSKLDEKGGGEGKEDKDIVLAIEGKEVKSTVPKEEKKKLVIPPVHRNQWRKGEGANQGDKGNTSSDSYINDLAVKELLQESAKENEKWEKREFQNYTPPIPMVIQNKVPDGFETDSALNTALRAEESALDEYEKIPIDDFGIALLRGLGCNPGDPLGNKNKKFVKPIETAPRSKGLGLGADKKPAKNSISHHAKEEEELKLVSGSYVCVIQGYHQGAYGQVEGLDESRAVIKLDRQNKNISVPLLYLEVISRKEYQKESRVINKRAYERYKREHEARNGYGHRRSRDPLISERTESRDKRRSSRERAEIENDYPSSSSRDNSKSHKKRKYDEEKRKRHGESDSENVENWVCPQLRVRLIDSEFRSGKYYKQKVTVEDVLSPDNCVCKTEDGRYLEGISPTMLETVIPRSEPSYVMIVDGKHKGQLGIILKRDKTNCIATVQFLSDREKVTKLNYDSVCEYVGDVSQFD